MTSTPATATIGPYRLLTPLGEGGMGVVHLAQAPDGRRVALKVLRPHVVGDVEARARLTREVATLRRVRSPRVAEVIDADTEGPLPYVVTRYVPGLSLYHHVEEEGVLAGRDLHHAMSCLVEALAAVHRVGVLHRDVKPTNVLMEGRAAVLIDFGLARVADDSRLTQAGFLMGTPGYLAPEILYGEEASPASDVHALAATLAFAATGRPPYGTGPTMAVMDRVRLGQHDLAGLSGPELELLTRCLSAEPADRPTLPQLAQWLATGLERGAGAAPPRPQQEPPWTMPFVAQPGPRDQVAPTAAVPPSLPVPTPAAAPAPQAAPTLGFRETGPREEPPPPAYRSRPGPTEVLGDGRPPASSPAPPAWQPPALRPPVSRAQRVAQLLGLGLLTGAVVAWAPYAGTATVALAVLVLRTASLTRQRHERRRVLRGRRRWYDAPATTLAVPAYTVGALGGTLGGVAVAVLVALAMFSIGFLVAQPVSTGLLLAGVGFVPALWWGPGSGRLRESVDRLVAPAARTDLGGWLVATVLVVTAAVLVSVLLGPGPVWSPGDAPPWR